VALTKAISQASREEVSPKRKESASISGQTRRSLNKSKPTTRKKKRYNLRLMKKGQSWAQKTYNKTTVMMFQSRKAKLSKYN